MSVPAATFRIGAMQFNNKIDIIAIEIPTKSVFSGNFLQKFFYKKNKSTVQIFKFILWISLLFTYQY